MSGAGPPDAPRNLTAVCDCPFSCLVSWEEPVNNGAAITSYQLQWSTEDDDESFCEVECFYIYFFVLNSILRKVLIMVCFNPVSLLIISLVEHQWFSGKVPASQSDS